MKQGRTLGVVNGVSIAVLAMAMLPAVAVAQDQTSEPEAVSPEPREPDAEAKMGVVVVTASRRSENLMDVPMAVSAVSEAQLQDGGAANTRDLDQLAPGLSMVTNGKLIQPSIRGVTSTSGGAGEEQNVAMYIDDVYMASATGNVFTLQNIERVEILKGPQGTLFGRNASGGAIRVFTKDPGQEVEFNASASYGTKLKSTDYSVYVSTPITDTLAVNFSGNIYDDKGYIENILPGWDQGDQGSTHSYIGRMKLAWTPTDYFKAILAYDQGRYQTDIPFSLAPYNDINSRRNTPGYIAPTGPYTVTNNFKPVTNNETNGVSLALTYDFDNYTLQSISAYRTNKLHSYLDSDRSNLLVGVTVTGDSNDWITQEFLLTSNFDGPFNYIAGLYYFDADADALVGGYGPGPVTTPGGGMTDPGPNTLLNYGYVKSDSISGFADGSFEVNDKFKLFAGIRYTTETKELETRSLIPARVSLTDETTWNNVSYRLTGQYFLTEDTNVYATYSTGFKSGTYNASNMVRIDKASPEEVEAFEVGLKSQLANGALNLAASAFHYNYDNIQITQTNAVDNVPVTVLNNAGVARMQGLELELTARPAEALWLKAGVSWLPEATYTQFANGLDSVPRGFPGSLDPTLCPGPSCGLGNDQIIRDLSDTRMIRAPELTTNLSATYERDFAGGRLEIVGNFFHTSRFYRAPGGHISEDPYSILNATAAWWLPGEKVRFALWGRNLTDELYYANLSANAQGLQVTPAAPREIGISLQYRY